MFRPLPTDEDLSGQRAGGWPRLLALRRSSPENDLVNLGAERAPSFALTASDPARTRGPASPATSRLLIIITAVPAAVSFGDTDGAEAVRLSRPSPTCPHYSIS